MNAWIVLTLIALVAYLIGSISFAIVVSRLRGMQDPRTYGSQNPGATNVLRSGDKVAAAWTLLGDAAKGLVVVMVVQQIAPLMLSAEQVPQAIAASAFSVFLGHLFPIYFRFQGGKGVATAFGVLLAMDWQMGLAVGLLWLAVAKITRISSLAALTAAVAAPLLAYWQHGADIVTWSVVGIAALLIVRHKKNIAQLRSGKEASFR